MAGILENIDADNKCLVFFRDIIHKECDIDKMKKEGYLDKTTEEMILLKELIESIEIKLNKANKFYFKVLLF